MVRGQQKLGKRRQTIKWYLIFLLTAASLFLPLFSSGVVESKERPDSIYPPLIDAVILRLKQSYGIQFCYYGIDKAGFKDGDMAFEEADMSDYKRLYRYIQIFDEEIQKYPADFFRQENLKEIYFVKRLFHKENNAEGLYDYRKKIIFFDFASQGGGMLVARHNIHHEIFHALDTNTFNWKEQDWEDLNEPDFEYVKTGKVFIGGEKNESNYFAPHRKGFVTYYAMKSAYEDKAEVFACLFIKSQNRLIHRWALNDPILEKKIQAIKRFLKEYSQGQIDELYFEKLWKNFTK
ncbi:MAG: putative zinc-binding metallopeptidase [Candidatus Omnitrophota bacterium]